MRAAYLGIDCGTQSSKALLLDAESGAVRAVGRAAHPIIERADGTREQQPEWWIKSLLEATAEARSIAGPIEIVGLAVSGQQHGLICLDATGRPLRPAKLWNDTTTAADCDDLTERLGGPSTVLGLTGNLFFPGYTAPKVAWLRRTEPRTYARADRFCLPHDYLNLWLTGEFATEPGDASGTAYFDVRSRRYAEQVLAALDPDRDWPACLPPVVPSLSVVGRLRGEAASALGLPPGIPVSAGGGDNMCAAIGAGAVVPGPVVVSIGTSGTAFAFRPEPAIDPEGEAAAFCSSTDGWLPLACTLNGTSATEWIRGLLHLELRDIEVALAASSPGADGLTFLPYLSGERTPNRPDGVGVLAGLRTHHGSAQLLRSVVEGVTFGLRYAMGALRRSGVEATVVKLVGGGAASDAWAQLCADIFGVPVERAHLTDAAALGAALQVRRVVDRVPFPAAGPGVSRWEPIPHPGLDEAWERFEALQLGQIREPVAVPSEPR